MADFRRWFLAFAALVLVLGSVVPASAQTVGPQISCSSVSTVTPALRSQGLTELVGDIVLTCTQTGASSGPTPVGSTIPQANITVTLGATLSTPTIGGGLDALLLVDDPAPGNQTPCPTPTNGLLCPVAGDGGQTFNQPGRYNVFQGISGGPGTNSISFLGVPIDPPVTGTRTYRITNIRIQGPSVTSGAYGLAPVYAFLSSSSSTSLQLTQTSLLPVGFVQNGLIVSYAAASPAPSFLQCVSEGQTAIGAVSFTEGFQTAFKTQNACPSPATPCQTTPGQVYYTESGLNVAVTGGTTGVATSGTELQTTIANIPSGVQIWADTMANDGVLGTSAVLVSPLGGTAGTGNSIQVIDNESGSPTSVTLVWEVVTANPFATDTLSFNIYASFTGAPGANGGSPQPNVTATESSGFSPQEAGGWTGGGPIPQFAVVNYPTPPAVQNLFSVALCQTVLLFPYVTDFYGFDTGIAISNTSADQLGTAPQTGACSVAFFGGTTAGASMNIGTTGNTPGFVDSDVTYNGVAQINGTGLIGAGQTWAFSLSNSDNTYNSAPGSGSTGYAIATCNFQFAHGYSFVSDTGIRNFAASYLALVIPDAARAPVPFVCASQSCNGSQPGEQLVH